MKAKYVLICMAVLTILPAVVCSCGVDRWAAYAERTKTDRWIDDTMRTWYYWYRDMPDENHVNYFVPPFEFFESVLSPKDGKGGYAYSTIDSLETGTRSIPYTDYSYGFQFTTNRVESNDTALYAHILYVAKDSPADEAGLQRGDVVQLGRETGDFYHTCLVTGFSAGGIPLVAAHSYNAFARPLSSYSFEKLRCLHIAGVRLPENEE